MLVVSGCSKHVGHNPFIKPKKCTVPGSGDYSGGLWECIPLYSKVLHNFFCNRSLNQSTPVITKL